MATAVQVLTKAISYLGYVDSRYVNGRRDNIFSEFFGRNDEAWCFDFVSYVLTACGMPFDESYVPRLISLAKALGEWHDGAYGLVPGDVIVWDYSTPGVWAVEEGDHISFCESVDGANVTSIDGNTSDASADNGGTVARKTRPAYLVYGYWRPSYEASNPVASPQRQDTMYALIPSEDPSTVPGMVSKLRAPEVSRKFGQPWLILVSRKPGVAIVSARQDDDDWQAQETVTFTAADQKRPVALGDNLGDEDFGEAIVDHDGCVDAGVYVERP